MRGMSLQLEASGMEQAGCRLESISRALFSSFDLAYHKINHDEGLTDLLMSGSSLAEGDHSNRWWQLPGSLVSIKGGEGHQEQHPSGPTGIQLAINPLRGLYEGSIATHSDPFVAALPWNPVTPSNHSDHHAAKTRPGCKGAINKDCFRRQEFQQTKPRRRIRDVRDIREPPGLVAVPSQPIWSDNRSSAHSQQLLLALDPLSYVPPPVSGSSERRFGPLRERGHLVLSTVDPVRERGYAAQANRLLWHMSLLYGRDAPPDPLDNNLCTHLAYLIKGLDTEIKQCLRHMGMSQNLIKSALSGTSV